MTRNQRIPKRPWHSSTYESGASDYVYNNATTKTTRLVHLHYNINDKPLFLAEVMDIQGTSEGGRLLKFRDKWEKQEDIIYAGVEYQEGVAT